MKFFLDANILMAATHVASEFRLHFGTAKWLGWSLLTSHYAVGEAAGNLAVRYPERLHDLAEISRRLVKVRKNPPVLEIMRTVELAEKDIPILNAAIVFGCGRLVTMDAGDFSHLFRKTIGGVKIITPDDFEDELKNAKIPPSKSNGCR